MNCHLAQIVIRVIYHMNRIFHKKRSDCSVVKRLLIILSNITLQSER